MSASNELGQVFSHTSVREFGATLRRALRIGDDYASLLDLEFAETKEAFAEALKRFLRRFEGLARRKKLRRPTQESLEALVGLVDQHGVKVVRAALISHALVRGEQDIAEEAEDTEDSSASSTSLTSGGEQS